MTDNARRRRRPGVNVTASDGESLTLDQAFDGDSLYALRAAVAAHGSQAGLSEGRTRDLVLAVHELAANAVRHGAGQGRLRLWAAHDAVRCEITDEGAPGEADAGGRGAVAGRARPRAVAGPPDRRFGQRSVRRVRYRRRRDLPAGAVMTV